MGCSSTRTILHIAPLHSKSIENKTLVETTSTIERAVRRLIDRLAPLAGISHTCHWRHTHCMAVAGVVVVGVCARRVRATDFHTRHTISSTSTIKIEIRLGFLQRIKTNNTTTTTINHIIYFQKYYVIFLYFFFFQINTR